MSNIYLSNYSSSPYTNGDVVIPVGTTVVPNSLEFRAEWNSGPAPAISEKTCCHVVTFGGTPTVEEIDNVSANYGNFMLGFSLMFCIGLLAIGARWARKAIVGGINE